MSDLLRGLSLCTAVQRGDSRSVKPSPETLQRCWTLVTYGETTSVNVQPDSGLTPQLSCELAGTLISTRVAFTGIEAGYKKFS